MTGRKDFTDRCPAATATGTAALRTPSIGCPAARGGSCAAAGPRGARASPGTSLLPPSGQACRLTADPYTSIACTERLASPRQSPPEPSPCRMPAGTTTGTSSRPAAPAAPAGLESACDGPEQCVSPKEAASEVSPRPGSRESKTINASLRCGTCVSRATISRNIYPKPRPKMSYCRLRQHATPPVGRQP